MKNSLNIPNSPNLTFFTPEITSDVSLPYVDGGIAAGFPSPAQDYVGEKIDLNAELVKNPSSTFYARAKGNSMKDEGINDGDLLVIDKSLEPKNGDTAVCFLDGDFVLKYIKIEKDAIYLEPANPEFKSIKVTEENNFCIWGIVTFSVKNHRK